MSPSGSKSLPSAGMKRIVPPTRIIRHIRERQDVGDKRVIAIIADPARSGASPPEPIGREAPATFRPQWDDISSS